MVDAGRNMGLLYWAVRLMVPSIGLVGLPEIDSIDQVIATGGNVGNNLDPPRLPNSRPLTPQPVVRLFTEPADDIVGTDAQRA